MKITKIDAPTYTIEGLDHETMIGLLSIVGKFGDNPEPEPHWHTRLYVALCKALDRHDEDQARTTDLYATADYPNGRRRIAVLHCHRT